MPCTRSTACEFFHTWKVVCPCPVTADVLPLNMRHFRLQITLRSLLAYVCLMAFACWFALPFRPTIEISDLMIEEGSVDQQGAFTLSAKITNRGSGTVYVQSAGQFVLRAFDGFAC